MMFNSSSTRRGRVHQAAKNLRRSQGIMIVKMLSLLKSSSVHIFSDGCHWQPLNIGQGWICQSCSFLLERLVIKKTNLFSALNQERQRS